MTPHLIAVILAEGGGLIILPVGLLAFAFWIWMIVDCIKHETEGSTKIAWLLAIVLVGVVGAPLYFFCSQNITQAVGGVSTSDEGLSALAKGRED